MRIDTPLSPTGIPNMNPAIRGGYRDERQVERTGHGDPAQDMLEMAHGGPSGTNARDESSLALDGLGLPFGVELDCRVEVREEHDEHGEYQDVGEARREPPLSPPPVSRLLSIQSRTAWPQPELGSDEDTSTGKYITLVAKMTGMTPAMLPSAGCRCSDRRELCVREPCVRTKSESCAGPGP